MIVVFRNAEKCFEKPILSALHHLNFNIQMMHDNHCNGYRQIFFENLLANQGFAVETAIFVAVSINHNHYNDV